MAENKLPSWDDTDELQDDSFDTQVQPEEVQHMYDGGIAAPTQAMEMPTWDDTQMLATSSPEAQSPEVPTWDATEDLQEKYGTGVEQAKAALEGLAQGVAGPLAPMVETSLGVEPEAIRARAEANPATHLASEVVGFVAPALLTGGTSAAGRGALSGLAKFTQAGAIEAAGKLVGKALPAGETLASKIGATSAKLAIENGLFSGSDEISKMILQDPSQTTETAMAHIGLGAALGGALGVPAGVVSEIVSKQGPKISRFIENVTGRLKEHIDNPDPVAAVGKELGEYLSKIESLHDDVYGPQGLKAMDIGKALPPMNENIATQATKTYELVNSSIKKMVEKPNSYPQRLVDKLQADLDMYESLLSKPEVAAADVFEAQQSLKKSLQNYAKFDRHVTPVSPEYDFIQQAKGLSNKIRTSLEDTAVWGKAGERQAAINKAFSEYLPTLKDFKSKFTTEVNGERVIDPGKISTYLNQLDKPNAEIKKDILRNFIDSTEKYKQVIRDSHANLGLESPVTDAALNNVLATFNKKTAGAKVADFIAKKFAPEALGTSAGASIGAMVAGPVGGAVGAIMGSHSLSPFFNQALPVLAGLFMKNTANPVAAKAAANLVMAAVKGEQVLDKGVKEIFKHTAEVVVPREVDTTKLDKTLRKIQQNPEILLNQTRQAAHYMPDHVSAADQTLMRAANYLNSLRPDEDKQAPLDSKPIVNSVAKAKYQNALRIAQDPMIVLDKMKQGTLTADDITALGTMYPAVYNKIKSKLLTESVEAVRKGQTIPYKTKISMSMFMGQPLDSTMTPAAIQSTQIQAPTGAHEQQAPQETKGVKSSPALQKMPDMYRTPSQTRVQRAQKQ